MPPELGEANRVQVAGEDYGASDIVINAFTPEALNSAWMSTDMQFREKARVKPEYRAGVSAAGYIEMMDRAGIERSLLVAQRSGDLRVQGSAHMLLDMNTFGQDKVLFGTDWPVVDPERVMVEVADIDWREGAKCKVLRDNALALFSL
ncbi:MAG: amidohydrolase family protein [Gammaproteobacteria bacterium]|nr:amidohydrolase family protein [Gammaproteobacteria bacterium]